MWGGGQARLCLEVGNNDGAKSRCRFCRSSNFEMPSAAKRIFHVRFIAGLFISNFPRVTWVISVRAQIIYQQVQVSPPDRDSSMHPSKSP